jgi:hypothetical protein
MMTTKMQWYVHKKETPHVAGPGVGLFTADAIPTSSSTAFEPGILASRGGSL